MKSWIRSLLILATITHVSSITGLLGGGQGSGNLLTSLNSAAAFLNGGGSEAGALVASGSLAGALEEVQVGAGLKRISQKDADKCERQLKRLEPYFKNAAFKLIGLDKKFDDIVEDFHQCKKKIAKKKKADVTQVVQKNLNSMKLSNVLAGDFDIKKALADQLNNAQKDLAKKIGEDALEACEKATDHQRQQCWHNKKKTCSLLNKMSEIMDPNTSQLQFTQLLPKAMEFLEEMKEFDARQRSINNAKKNCKCIDKTAKTIIASLTGKQGTIDDCVKDLPKSVRNSLTRGARTGGTWAVIKNPGKVIGGVARGSAAAARASAPAAVGKNGGGGFLGNLLGSFTG